MLGMRKMMNFNRKKYLNQVRVSSRTNNVLFDRRFWLFDFQSDHFCWSGWVWVSNFPEFIVDVSKFVF